MPIKALQVASAGESSNWRRVTARGMSACSGRRPEVTRGHNSDIDLLVDIEPGRTLLDLIALEQDLEELLGRPVEVLTDGGLSPYLQERILAEAAAL